MKVKSTEKVINDLRNLFEIDNKDNHEITGRFLIYKRRFKRKKVAQMLSKYFSKVKIDNGSLIQMDKSIAYSRFNIVKNGKRKKEEKEQDKKAKRTKQKN